MLIYAHAIQRQRGPESRTTPVCEEVVSRQHREGAGAWQSVPKDLLRGEQGRNFREDKKFSARDILREGLVAQCTAASARSWDRVFHIGRRHNRSRVLPNTWTPTRYR